MTDEYQKAWHIGDGFFNAVVKLRVDDTLGLFEDGPEPAATGMDPVRWACEIAHPTRTVRPRTRISVTRSANAAAEALDSAGVNDSAGAATFRAGEGRGRVECLWRVPECGPELVQLSRRSFKHASTLRLLLLRVAMIPPSGAPGSVATRTHPPRTVLLCLCNEDILAARHCLQTTPQLAESIGSLEFKIGLYGIFEGAVDLPSLGQVIALCPNLDALRVGGRLDLEGFAMQLLQQHAGGLPKMRHLRFDYSSTIPPLLLLRLLQTMPNLQCCEALPKTPGDQPVGADDLASFIGPIRTQWLDVYVDNAEYFLPLFLSRRWIARRIFLTLDPAFFRTLLDYGGPLSDSVDVVDISLRSWTKESPAPLTSWMTRACPALRRLTLCAYNEYMLELFPLLTTGVFRLRELELVFLIDIPPSGEQTIIDVAALLLSWLPALTTLRTLRIFLGGVIGQGPYGHHMHDVRLLCHNRRIIYFLSGTFSGYAAPVSHSPPPTQA